MKIKESFKAKLILVLVVALLTPILLITFISINRNTEYVEENVNRNNMELAKSLKEKVEITINNSQDVMEILSKRNIIQKMEPDQNVDDFFFFFVKDYPTITQIYFMQ